MESGGRRANDELTADQAANEAGEQLTEEIQVEGAVEERKKFRTPGFTRMRFDWAHDEDRVVVAASHRLADETIQSTFRDAFILLARLYDIIREPELVPDSNGEMVSHRDAQGNVVWKRDHDDHWYIEDWSNLSRREMENFYGSIMTMMFSWEQRSDQMWSEAMYAKASFEERFAIAFDEPKTGTEGVRKAKGNVDAAEERYFALYLAYLSRRAASVVRSMERVGRTLKDLILA